MKVFLALFSIMFLAVSCANVSTISNPSSASSNPNEGLSEKFAKKMGQIKELYRKNQADKALSELKGINDSSLNSIEKATKDNFEGIIYFSKGRLDDALKSFTSAADKSKAQVNFSSQVNLNLAGTYFRKGLSQKAFEVIQKIPEGVLKGEEEKKYHTLSARLAKDLEKTDEEMHHLAFILKEKKTLAELKADSSFNRLKTLVEAKDQNFRLKFFDKHIQDSQFAIGYLAYETAEKTFYSGDRSSAKDLLDWTSKYYEKNLELQDLIKTLRGRIENFSKIDIKALGIVLPLSGDKKEFSERILNGIDIALKQNKDFTPTLHIKDSEGQGPSGALAIKELIEKNMVAGVIGGLFPDEATSEYLEARKNGVFFISLSPIYLPKEKKDHLLFEITGSIESQMHDIFSSGMINQLGKRAAIVYPRGARGESYVEEFWRRANLSGVEVTGIASFEKNQTDYRETVKGLLELKYKRERQEELELLSSVQSFEKNTIRRVQTLGPQVDFDWVFLPALPKEALQIIPAFAYFDAFKVAYVGDASWRSQLMARETGRVDRLYFIADNLDPEEQVFSKEFEAKFNQTPKLLEYMGFDSLKIVTELLSQSKSDSRDEFDQFIKSKEELAGLTGRWKLLEGVWMKDLGLYSIKRGKIEPVESSTK